jgi:hypothetical protein
METAGLEWIVSSNEETLSLPDGYIAAFVHFHERGLTTSAHRFL